LTVILSNNGAYDGEEVVQLYVGDPAASLTRAVRELKNFKKVFVQTGDRVQVTFVVTTEDLKFFNSNLDYIWEEGIFNIYIGQDSVNTKSIEINWLKQ